MKQQAFRSGILMIGACLLLCGCTGRTERFLYEEAGKGGAPELVKAPEEETPDGENEVPEQGSKELPPSDGEETVQIYVDVCGAVRFPGVYILPGGSRIYNAVEAAGGFLEEAAPESVNQAALLNDAQQIYIPTQEEAAGEGVLYLSDRYDAGQLSSGPGDGKIDLNTADMDQLCSLPGIGEAKAEAILSYRNQFGPFASPEELMNVSGIKEGTYAKIREMITVR